MSASQLASLDEGTILTSALGILSLVQAAHEFVDQDLALLFEKIVALLGKGQLSLQGEQVRLGWCDIEFGHKTILL